jgi:hypothetical protein
MHLTYHAGDRHVEDFPDRDLDVDDQAIADYLLGATHSDGSKIWTLEKPALEPEPEREAPSPIVQVKATDGGSATNKTA